MQERATTRLYNKIRPGAHADYVSIQGAVFALNSRVFGFRRLAASSAENWGCTSSSQVVTTERQLPSAPCQ